jgi:HK97 family phage prohead protease
MEKFEAREENGKKVIQGYFAVYNQKTELWPGVWEVIKPGAFSGAKDVRALVNHDSTKVLGRTAAGTMQIRDDSYGLYATIDINENDTDALNSHARTERGDVDQASFGGYIRKEGTIWHDNGEVTFELEEVELLEVSVCTFPQYEQTGIEARHKQVDAHRQKLLDAKREKLKEALKSVFE